MWFRQAMRFGFPTYGEFAVHCWRQSPLRAGEAWRRAADRLIVNRSAAVAVAAVAGLTAAPMHRPVSSPAE
jgi:hypothetical protein